MPTLLSQKSQTLNVHLVEDKCLQKLVGTFDLTLLLPVNVLASLIDTHYWFSTAILRVFILVAI